MLCHHATDRTAAESIRRTGFDLTWAGSNWGCLFGRAVYLTDDATTLDYYKPVRNPAVITADVQTKNPYVYHCTDDTDGRTAREDVMMALLAAIPEDKRQSISYTTSPADLLPLTPYDAIVVRQDYFHPSVGGTQIVVADTSLITILPEE